MERLGLFGTGKTRNAPAAISKKPIPCPRRSKVEFEVHNRKSRKAVIVDADKAIGASRYERRANTTPPKLRPEKLPTLRTAVPH